MDDDWSRLYWLCRDNPGEAADRLEQLERELSTCRMAQIVMDNTVETLTDELRAARFLLKGETP